MITNLRECVFKEVRKELAKVESQFLWRRNLKRGIILEL